MKKVCSLYTKDLKEYTVCDVKIEHIDNSAILTLYPCDYHAAIVIGIPLHVPIEIDKGGK